MENTFNIGDSVRFRRNCEIGTRLGTVRGHEKSSMGNYILVEVSVVESDGQKLWWIHESNVLPPLWKISPRIRGLSQNCGYY